MTNQRQSGFTIIEVVLFLAITGGLFTALMYGVNSNIAEQRYRDSVVSYGALLQKQYAEVSNVRNDRDMKWRCNSSQVESTVDGGEARGTSTCVILGRFIHIKDNGQKVEVGSVIGSQPADEADLVSDIAALTAYRPRQSPVDTETINIDWQSQLKTLSGEVTTASVLIVRSPVSGLVRTFASSSPQVNNLSAMLTTEAARAQIVSCVLPTDGRASGPAQSVTLSAAVSGPNGVVINRNDERC